MENVRFLLLQDWVQVAGRQTKTKDGLFPLQSISVSSIFPNGGLLELRRERPTAPQPDHDFPCTGDFLPLMGWSVVYTFASHGFVAVSTRVSLK